MASQLRRCFARQWHRHLPVFKTSYFMLRPSTSVQGRLGFLRGFHRTRNCAALSVLPFPDTTSKSTYSLTSLNEPAQASSMPLTLQSSEGSTTDQYPKTRRSASCQLQSRKFYKLVQKYVLVGHHRSDYPDTDEVQYYSTLAGANKALKTTAGYYRKWYDAEDPDCVRTSADCNKYLTMNEFYEDDKGILHLNEHQELSTYMGHVHALHIEEVWLKLDLAAKVPKTKKRRGYSCGEWFEPPAADTHVRVVRGEWIKIEDSPKAMSKGYEEEGEEEEGEEEDQNDYEEDDDDDYDQESEGESR